MAVDPSEALIFNIQFNDGSDGTGNTTNPGSESGGSGFKELEICINGVKQVILVPVSVGSQASDIFDPLDVPRAAEDVENAIDSENIQNESEALTPLASIPRITVDNSNSFSRLLCNRVSTDSVTPLSASNANQLTSIYTTSSVQSTPSNNQSISTSRSETSSTENPTSTTSLYTTSSNIENTSVRFSIPNSAAHSTVTTSSVSSARTGRTRISAHNTLVDLSDLPDSPPPASKSPDLLTRPASCGSTPSTNAARSESHHAVSDDYPVLRQMFPQSFNRLSRFLMDGSRRTDSGNLCIGMASNILNGASQSMVGNAGFGSGISSSLQARQHNAGTLIGGQGQPFIARATYCGYNTDSSQTGLASNNTLDNSSMPTLSASDLRTNINLPTYNAYDGLRTNVQSHLFDEARGVVHWNAQPSSVATSFLPVIAENEPSCLPDFERLGVYSKPTRSVFLPVSRPSLQSPVSSHFTTALLSQNSSSVQGLSSNSHVPSSLISYRCSTHTGVHNVPNNGLMSGCSNYRLPCLSNVGLNNRNFLDELFGDDGSSLSGVNLDLPSSVYSEGWGNTDTSNINSRINPHQDLLQVTQINWPTVTAGVPRVSAVLNSAMPSILGAPNIVSSYVPSSQIRNASISSLSYMERKRFPSVSSLNNILPDIYGTQTDQNNLGVVENQFSFGNHDFIVSSAVTSTQNCSVSVVPCHQPNQSNEAVNRLSTLQSYHPDRVQSNSSNPESNSIIPPANIVVHENINVSNSVLNLNRISDSTNTAVSPQKKCAVIAPAPRVKSCATGKTRETARKRTSKSRIHSDLQKWINEKVSVRRPSLSSNVSSLNCVESNDFSGRSKNVSNENNQISRDTENFSLREIYRLTERIVNETCANETSDTGVASLCKSQLVSQDKIALTSEDKDRSKSVEMSSKSVDVIKDTVRSRDNDAREMGDQIKRIEPAVTSSNKLETDCINNATRSQTKKYISCGKSPRNFVSNKESRKKGRKRRRKHSISLASSDDEYDDDSTDSWQPAIDDDDDDSDYEIEEESDMEENNWLESDFTDNSNAGSESSWSSNDSVTMGKHRNRERKSKRSSAFANRRSRLKALAQRLKVEDDCRRSRRRGARSRIKEWSSYKSPYLRERDDIADPSTFISLEVLLLNGSKSVRIADMDKILCCRLARIPVTVGLASLSEGSIENKSDVVLEPGDQAKDTSVRCLSSRGATWTRCCGGISAVARKVENEEKKVWEGTKIKIKLGKRLVVSSDEESFHSVRQKKKRRRILESSSSCESG